MENDINLYEMCTKIDAHGLFEVTNNDIQRFRVQNGIARKKTIDRNIQSKGEIFLYDDNGISDYQ